MTPQTTLIFWSLLLGLCMLGINRGLWTPDEPREAEISREMFLAPSVVPSLNGETFVEKPPLYYWTVAGAFAAFGEPSIVAVRAVSAIASFLTLVLVFLWGRREFSDRVGYVAAFGLATSAQFTISSHWVLIDPLLMLFTTVALYSAHRIVRGGADGRTMAVFQIALVLALWTKGLIGPVLVAASLTGYAIARRSVEPLRRVRPVLTVLIIGVATATFAGLLGVESGSDAVREWFWVNHVQRFLDPTTTGHDQPLYYYLSAIPVAVLPWLAPFVAAWRPSVWRATAEGMHAASREAMTFFGSACLAMALVLSASATKRSIYLLPLLPPLFVLLAAIATEWWSRRNTGWFRTRAWRWQLAVVAAFAGIPVALGLVYLGTFDPLAVTFLIGVVGLWITADTFARHGKHNKALVAVGGVSIGGIVGLLGIVVHLAASTRTFEPFLRSASARDSQSQSVYVVGDFDETVRGIVPFVTGKTAVHISPEELDAVHPRFVLVHMKDGDRAPTLWGTYDLIVGRRFGPDRYMAVWRRRDR